MRFHILLFTLLLCFCAGAQCNLRPVSLAERVQSSELVVEGTVIATWSRWDDLHQNIYTINVVEVLGTFKGQTGDTVVHIVTPGGHVGNELEITTHALELNKGKTGLFTLIANSKPLTEAWPLYEVYAATQGFLQYDRTEHKAHGVFDHYNSLEVLYPAVLSQPGTALQRRKAISWTKVNDLPYSLEDVLQSVNESYLQGDTLYSEQVASAVASGATISSLSPTTVQAGRGTLLTINGSGFGATQGTSYVQFLNADAGGASYTSPAATQYVSWSDTQIQVYVPTAAGTGTVRVTDGTNTATSATVLTVEYAILNVNYSGSYYRPNLVNTNTTGGYTFQLNTAFDANTAAKTDFQNIVYQWRCGTGINWVFGNTTAIAATASDGVNIVRFDSGTELSTGVLGTCVSRYSGCTDGTNFYWYVTELDVTIDDGTNYFYGNTGTPSASQYDFYSVMLHELGHGHQLGHVIDPIKVMHYSLANGVQKRTISATELAGASYELSQSTAGGTCLATAHIDYSCNPSVTLSTGTSSISETSGTSTVTATLSKLCFSDVTVTLGLTGTATTTADYTLGTSILIPSGSLSASVTLAAAGDPADEPDETVVIDITGVTNGTENGVQQQTVTILDDDAAPTVTLTTGTGTISETGGSTTVTATLSAAASQTVTVTLGLTGTATAAADYTLGTSIAIPAGSTSASITLAAVGDITDEADETVIVDITGVTNSTENGTQQQTVTILDDDAAPTVTLTTGTTNITETGGSTTVTATLSAASSLIVTVTLGLTGTAADGTDYTLGTTIAIPAGNTSASITLAAVGDVTDEADETVIVDITAVTNGSENAAQQQTVTILDDDAAPLVTLSVGTTSIPEASGSTTVTATLSAVSGQTVTVQLDLSGTAASATDYTLATTITIPAGSTSASAMIAAVNDGMDEADETVVIGIQTIGNGTPAAAGATETVTILDDDAAPVVSLSVAAATVGEGAAVQVTATLSAASSQNITVQLATNGTASAGDYALPATLTVPAGATSFSEMLAAQEDVVDEADETVVIDITGVTNGTENGTQQQTVTIIDNDMPPVLSLSASTLAIAENAGTSTITATLSAISEQTVNITFNTAGSAVSGTDYAVIPDLSIPAGSLSASTVLTAIDDAMPEPDELAVLTLATVTNATDPGTTVTITITDDEQPEIAVSSGTSGATYDFGSVPVGSAATATFTISNSGTNDLVLSDAGYIVLSGPDAASFSLETSGLVHVLAPGSSISFDVTVTAACAASAYSALLTIPNNDGDEGSFTIFLTADPEDQTAPVATVASLPVLSGECSVTAPAPSATDNCSGTLTGTTADPLSYTTAGTYTIHWTYTDAAGNVSSQDQQVTVTGDVTAPEISCPDDIVSTVPEVAYTLPAATDNCSATTVALQTGLASGSTFPEGTTTVTYTATDAMGNTASCSFVVTVSTSGITEEAAATISLYPNPASDHVTVTTNGMFSSVCIYDSKGALAAIHQLSGMSSVIPLNALETGLYYMTFNGPDATAVRKLEVLH